MPSPENRPPLILLVGPTAVGKTTVSLDLAMRINAEIISADSRLFYRGMDIGTAKPSPSEQARIPHHLIDFLIPDQTYSLSEFQAAVYHLAADIHARQHLPLLVGGTGQYVRAITEGWRIPRQEPAPHLRAALARQAETSGAAGLHRWLAALDPASAARIDHRNLRRTIRALEVTLVTGQPFSEQRRAGQPRFRTLTIGLIRPRQELYARIDSRIEAMFANGLIDEIRSLIESGYSPELPAMSAIGYKEVGMFLTGLISFDEAINSMKRRTRALVRRQANWFKPDDPTIRWAHPDEDLTPVIEEFLSGEG